MIAEAFGFEWPQKVSPEQRAIKHADRQALLMETLRLLPDGGKALRGDKGLGEGELAPLEEPLPPGDAEKLFTLAHTEHIGNGPRP